MKFLRIDLSGPMQAWGGHTFENTRPTEMFPTRSGLSGFLACALGIPRIRPQDVAKVNESYLYAVRETSPSASEKVRYDETKFVDYHIVQNVRTICGKTKNEITYREYLANMSFTVFLSCIDGAKYTVEDFGEALQHPGYTLYLGRKCCPLTKPPFGGCFEGDSVEEMFKKHAPNGGVIYSEFDAPGKPFVVVRDVKIAPGKYLNRKVRYFSLTPEETV